MYFAPTDTKANALLYLRINYKNLFDESSFYVFINKSIKNYGYYPLGLDLTYP